MQQVKNGDKVKVHYHGKLRNGDTFDSSEGREPLEFNVGGGLVIKGFDNGVMGMQVGDKKTVEIPVQDAYGEKQDEMMIEFPKDQFPAEMNPEVGMQLMMNNGAGQQFPVTVAEVRETTVVLDANHPLAGQELNFSVEVMDVRNATKEELDHGHVHGPGGHHHHPPPAIGSTRERVMAPSERPLR